ncbi:LOW QUALITY PROTEIN: hypothetical protein ACHAWF_013351 [Thalassiosira exigua]
MRASWGAPKQFPPIALKSGGDARIRLKSGRRQSGQRRVRIQSGSPTWRGCGGVWGDSSSSSSSSSSNEEERSPIAKRGDIGAAESAADNGDHRKAFLSRVPQKFDEGVVKRILEERFGFGSIEESGEADNKRAKEKGDNAPKGHCGFGFATFASSSLRDAVIDASTVCGSAKAVSKRKHTLYVRPVDAGGGDGAPSAKKKRQQKCFSFKKRGKCKLGAFSHDVAAKEAESAAIPDGDGTSKDAGDKSRKYCINWKNKGKCRKGTTCPHQHDPSIREKLLIDKDTSAAEKKRKDKATKNNQSLSVRVFGLNYDTSEEELCAFFSSCGPVAELTFPAFKDSGRSKGYCGVLFQKSQGRGRGGGIGREGIEGTVTAGAGGEDVLAKVGGGRAGAEGGEGGGGEGERGGAGGGGIRPEGEEEEAARVQGMSGAVVDMGLDAAETRSFSDSLAARPLLSWLGSRRERESDNLKKARIEI